MSEPETTDQPLPLVVHLTELRDKLLRALLVVLVLFIDIYSTPVFETNLTVCQTVICDFLCIFIFSLIVIMQQRHALRHVACKS